MGGPSSRSVLGLTASDVDLAVLQAVRGRGEITAADVAIIFGTDARVMTTALERVCERGWLNRISAPAAGSPDVDSWSLNEEGDDVRWRLLVDEAFDAAKRLAITRAHAILSPLDGLVRDLREHATGTPPRAIDDDDDHRRAPALEYELHTRAERVVTHLAERVPRFSHHAVRLAGNDPLGLVRPVSGGGQLDSYASAWTDLMGDIRSSVDDRSAAGLMRGRPDGYPAANHPSPR